jgi:PHD/YefM family antitoxin component YafN of YafNO toxin-antitoxin module/predicted transcriptional regulator
MSENALKPLDQLAKTAAEEHRLAGESMGNAVEHSILCGKSIAEAASLLTAEEWESWLAKIYLTPGDGARYMSLAERSEEAQTAIGVFDKLNELSKAFSPENEKMKELRNSGMKVKDIAAKFGTSTTTVYRYTHPGGAYAWDCERIRRREQAEEERRRFSEKSQAALSREHNKKSASVSGGTARAYNNVRIALSALEFERVRGNQAPEALRAIGAAMDALYVAEDLIVAAAKTGNTALLTA